MPKNSNSSDDPPITEGTGIGPNQTKTIIKRQSILADLEYAKNKGIIPAEGFNWNRDDPESVYSFGFRKFTDERKAFFLNKFSENGNQILSALFSGIHPNTVQEHRKIDPEFGEAC